MLFKNRTYNKLIEEAKKCYQNEDLTGAVKWYEEAFSIKAILHDFIMYGYILIDLGEYTKSEKIFTDLIGKYDVVETNFALANIYERTNRFKDAISKYEKVIQLSPDFEQAHFSLAYIYDDFSEENKEEYDSINTKKAIEHYEITLKLNENNYWANINLGSIYERYNNNDLALSYFLKAYDINKDNEMVCFNLGVAYYKLKQYDKSLYYYLEELKNKKPSPNTYYNLGILYKDGFNDYEKAKFYYLKGLEINQEDYNIWYNLGCVHALLNDFENCYECFKYIYYKNKKYLNYIEKDKELEQFRNTEYYTLLKQNNI